MRFSILGPPQSGKTTLMRALSGEGALSHTSDHIERVLKKRDERLEKLAEVYKPSRVVFPEIHLEEIVTLRMGKKGVLNPRVRLAQFLIGVFRDKKDLDVLKEEFVLEDLSLVEKRLLSVEKDMRKGKKSLEAEEKALRWIKDALEKGSFDVVPDFAEPFIRNFQLLSFKKIIPILNIDDYQEGRWDNGWLVVNLDLEKEIILSGDRSLMNEFGLKKLVLEEFWDEVFKRIGLITFYTVTKREAKAWVVEEGTKAIEAAGMIHSDIEKGFIKAEVFNFKDLEEVSFNEKALKDKGLVRSEGKEYIIKDGDVVYFRFNV